jgi:hypothetical protein
MNRISKRDMSSSRSRRASLACLAFAALSLSEGTVAQNISGTFTDANSYPGWVVSSGAKVKTPIDGSGWLRLMSAEDRGLGRVQATSALPTNAPIRVEFDVVTWGGWRFMNDGLTLYFYDPAAPKAGQDALSGGAMGYCNMGGAYLGVAIDDYGNFSTTRCGYNHGWMPVSGFTRKLHGNSVAVRGPKTGNSLTSQPLVKSVPLKGIVDPICYGCGTRDEAIGKALRHVVFEMTPRALPDGGYVLNMSINGHEILRNEVFAHAAPAQLMMGLVSSAGSSSAIQEVRDIKVSVAPPICFNGTRPDGTCLPADNALNNWDVFTNVGFLYSGDAPREWVDGDLVQQGWNGAAPWTKTAPTMPRECMQVGSRAKPDWLPGGGPTKANQIVIVSRQDDVAEAADPTESTAFTRRGAVDFKVEYSTDWGNTHKLVPGGEVVANDKVMRIFTLPQVEALTNTRVTICKTADGGTSPLAEVLVREQK